jgi:ornithine cyclodeaminase
VRRLTTVVAWDPSSANLEELGRIVTSLGLAYRAARCAEEAAACADILTTVTPSTQAIVMRSWVRPGTHINAMGADTVGKQELATDLVASCRVVVDDVVQAMTIGECQHACAQGLLQRDAMTTLGGVASGRFPGRRNESEITLFDGTGIALQDLAPAAVAVRRARERGLGTEVAF